MFSLPIIFLCNTVVFAFLMEERFKVLTTSIISAAAFLLSIVSGTIVDGMVSDPALSGLIANGVCVLWLLVASVFISSNNIMQKIFVALLLITNFSFFTDFIPVIIGKMPFATSGILGLILGNGLFILFSLLSMSLFIKPLHYFYRRNISVSIIGLCILQLMCWFIAKGGLTDYFGYDSFSTRFFITLFLYIIIVFTERSAFGSAKYKAKDVNITADDTIRNIRADNFGDVLMNIDSIKSAKKNVEYAFDRIGILAEAGKTNEILNYVQLAKANNRTSPLLDFYCDDNYINAIVATKAAIAEEKGIRFESNISLNDTRVEILDLCNLINDVLNMEIKDCTESSDEDKFVRINVLPTNNQLTVECVHSTGEKSKTPIMKKTAFDFIKGLFDKIDDDESEEIRSVRGIVEKYSGKISVSQIDNTTVTRIGINN